MQAACATIASPESYDPVGIGEEEDQAQYIDAMAGYANPTNELLKEAEKVFVKNAMVANIISIGSGKPQIDQQNMNLNDALRRAITDTERVHNDIQNRLHDLGIYFRFNVDGILPMKNLVGKTTRVQTAAYLEEAANSKRMDEAVTSIQERNGIKNLKELSTCINLKPKLYLTSLLDSITAVEVKYKQRPAVVSFFVGRQDILDHLHETHIEKPEPEGEYPTISVLVGLGGSGKSQIALQFAKQFEKISEQRIKEDYQAIIRSRGPAYRSSTYEGALEWLATTDQPWLIIADNADDPSIDLHPFLPQCSRGHFIITSRNTNQSLMAQTHAYHTEALESEESVKLLLNISGYEENDLNASHAREIVKVLGHLPLAVVQAAGYIFKHKYLSSYLEIYNESKEDILSQRAKELPHGYDLSVATTLEMSFNKLSANTKAVLRILSFLQNASIAHKIIVDAAKNRFFYASGKAKEADNERLDEIKQESEELCKVFCPKGKWSEAEFYKIIEPCFQYSLLHSTVSEDDQKFYSMHILVKSWLQLQSSPSDQISSMRLSRRMLLAVIKESSTYEYLGLYQMLLPHLSAFSGSPLDFATDDFLLYEVFLETGDPLTADLHLTAYIEMARGRVQWDAPEWLEALCERTWSLIVLGRHHDASKAGAEATELCIKALGQDNPRTLSSMNDLALSYSNLGEYQKAREMDEDILARRKSVLGPEHSDTLTSMNNLALDYINLLQYEDAQKLNEETLALRKRLSGPENPDTLLSLSNLAWTYSNLGFYEKAIEMNEETISLRKKVLGPEHPDTLFSLSNLALNYLEFGQDEKARDIEEKTLLIRKRVLGAEHTDTLVSMSNLAWAYSNLGQHVKSREINEATLALRKKTLGPEHPDTLQTMNNLAVNYVDLEMYAKACEVNKEVVELRRRVLGPEHPHTLLSMANLCVNYIDMGSYKEAQEIGEETLKLRQKVLGPDHSDTLFIAKELEQLHARQSEFTELSRRLVRSELGSRITRTQSGFERSLTPSTAPHLIVIPGKNGGVNPLSALYIIDEMLQRLKFDIEFDEDLRACDWFDMIIGSGNGGIVALLLGRLRMTASQAIKACNSLVTVLVTAPAEKKKERELNRENFSAMFEKVLVEAGYDVSKPMRVGVGGNGICKFIRSYSTRGMNTPNCTILQAACATIASPDSYEPVTIGEEDDQIECIDAMAGYANPTSELLKEAERVFGKTALVATITSVGSGKQELRQWQSDIAKKMLNDVLKRAITDTERVHNSIQSRFQDLGIYFRFNIESSPPFDSSTGKITKAQTMAYLEDAITSQRMDGVIKLIQDRKGIKALRDLNSITSVEITYKQRPAVVPFFVGRQDILDHLHETHIAKPSPQGEYPSISVLTGLGGSGKTQIALQFAKQFESASEDRIKEDYQAIIRSRGPAYRSSTYEVTLQWLVNTESPWMIIADNADDPSIDLHPFLPRCPRGHFIITSRNANQGLMAPAHTHHIESLNTDDSIRLLLEVSAYEPIDVNLNHAAAIVLALGHLPLAIAQAAGYIYKH
ncbi:14986_t:CDS:2, partial [Acaulospora colombiana]